MTQSRKTRVAVIFGGRSGEHEVSLASARSVISALDPAKFEVLPVGITPQGQWLTSGDPLKQLSSGQPVPDDQSAALRHLGVTALVPTAASHPTEAAGSLAEVDIIFPVLHGPYGEDGTVQGLFELINLPYVGAGVAASAVGMDKALMKALFMAAGLPILPYQVVSRHEWEGNRAATLARIESHLPYPMFVKPANLGSSVGVSRALDRTGLGVALDLASRYDRKIVVEQGLAGAREIEISVLGNDDPEASVAGEIIPHAHHQFYNYAAKYTPGEADLVIPAPIAPEMLTTLQEMALRAYHAIDGAGLARADFLVDPINNDIYVNELNTMPGFTATSMYARLWEASGLSYAQLLERLITLGLERYADKQRNHIGRDAHPTP